MGWLVYEHMFVETGQVDRGQPEDFAALSREQLEAELVAQAALVDAGTCRLLLLEAESERRLDWVSDGVNHAEWLSWRIGLSPRQAREHGRVRERLAELPLVQEAFARGELSYGKVRVLARIPAPESEQRLLELAGAMTTSQLERAAGAFQRVTREEAATEQEREFLSYFWTEQGSLSLRAQLAGENGALLLSALDAGREALWQRAQAEAAAADPDATTRADGKPARPSHAEALVAVADLALAAPGGDRGGAERHQVVVHVDAAVLSHDAEGRCEHGEGHPLAADTARRLACDSSIVELLERDGQPLTLGRKRRTINPALRRALDARDRACRFPGCTNTRFLDGHHVQHWSQGGETNLDNLLLLCSRHHRLVHERGFTVRLDDSGEAVFTNEYGIELDNVPRPPPLDHLDDRLRCARRVVENTKPKNGLGDPMNLGLAVDAIIVATGYTWTPRSTWDTPAPRWNGETPDEPPSRAVDEERSSNRRGSGNPEDRE